MRVAIVAIALALAGCASQKTETDIDYVVSDPAPAVTLYDAQGDPISLESLYTEQPIVLMFYRGGWCPFCSRALKDWRTRVDEVQSAGARLVAITPESPDNYARTIDKNDLNYTVLGDPDFAAARAFDVYDELTEEEKDTYESYGIDIAANNSSGTWALPLPGTFVIDTEGVVRYAFINEDYKKRADPDDVLAILAEIGAN